MNARLSAASLPVNCCSGGAFTLAVRDVCSDPVRGNVDSSGHADPLPQMAQSVNYAVGALATVGLIVIYDHLGEIDHALSSHFRTGTFL